MTQTQSVTLTKKQNIALITFDSPNEKVNTLNQPILNQLLDAIEKVEKDSSLEAAVIISGKENNFIAGGDLREISKAKSAAEAESACLYAQEIFDRIAYSKKPYLAAIHGGCIGGGLELALACHFRLATLEPKTIFAFPEVTLGLLPAGGGTQRLPRLIGLKSALEMLLSGRKINAKQAHHLGLIDAVINLREELELGAFRLINELIQKHTHPKKMKSLSFVSLIPLCLAKRQVRKKTFGHYPSPFAILDALKRGILHGFQQGLKEEAKQFGKLTQTEVCKNLLWLFFAQKEHQKNPFTLKGEPAKELGVVGSGLMGTGITYVSLRGDLEVHLNDTNHKALSHAEDFISKELDREVKKNIITNLDRKRFASKLTVSTSFEHFNRCDAVIEAIFEDLNVKRELLRKLEANLKPGCIFATNTSSLPIAQMAEDSAIKDRIVGMHYFSPANKIPLLEIVRSKYTSEETLAKACDIGLRQRKTLIVVRDSVGFYTTRVIAALLDEACILLMEGYEPKIIDHSLRKIGFPMGPLALTDEVGLDVGLHISQILQAQYGKRLISADLFLSEQMVKSKFLGRKTGRGFYVYGAHRQGVNKDLYEFLKPLRHRTPQKPLASFEIGSRMFLRMVNEAAYCLSEKVIESGDDGDVGAVFGLGFPAYLAGPFHYINSQGKIKVANTLDHLSKHLGERFTKAPLFNA